MKKWITYLLVMLLALAALALFIARTDREFINLPADEGSTSGIVLEAENTYLQTFIPTRSTITRLGLFIRPHVANLPTSNLTVSISQTGQTLVAHTLNTNFIDNESPTQISFAPLHVIENEPVTIQISVPNELNGALRLQQRQPDNSFNDRNVTFYINDQPQEAPLGYQVYSLYHPAMAIQLGGLLIVAALYLLFRNIFVYLLLVPIIFTVPAIGTLDNYQLPLTLLAATSVSLAGFFLLLRRQNLSLLPALTGANFFAFSTWLPLHLLAGRGLYALIALLPLGYLLLTDRSLSRQRQRQLLLATILYCAVLLFLLSPPFLPSLSSDVTGSATLRDIFLDPNQTLAAEKVPGRSWDNFGSYIGLINGALAAIGLVAVARQRRHWPALAIGLAGLLITWLPISAAPHFIILTTFTLAYCAGFGLEALRQFLGSKPHQTNTTLSIIIFLISLYALLDLWQVAANTLEYSL